MFSRKCQSGYDKHKKKRRIEQLTQSQKGALDKFIIKEPQGSSKDLVNEQHDGGEKFVITDNISHNENVDNESNDHIDDDIGHNKNVENLDNNENNDDEYADNIDMMNNLMHSFYWIFIIQEIGIFLILNW